MICDAFSVCEPKQFWEVVEELKEAIREVESQIVQEETCSCETSA